MVKGVWKLIELVVTFTCVCDKRKSRIEPVFEPIERAGGGFVEMCFKKERKRPRCRQKLNTDSVAS